MKITAYGTPPDDRTMSRHRVDGVWHYDTRDAMAALRLGVFGLRLDELDDCIEAARQAGVTEAVRFLEGERGRLLRLLDHDANGLAVRDAARWIAGLLREGRLIPKAEMGECFYGKGKAPTTLGKWLDKALARDPLATTAALWQLLANAPPSGHVFEKDSSGGTLYRVKPWKEACPRDKWRDRVRRARERAIKRAAK